MAGEEIVVERSVPEDPEDASWEWHRKRKQQEDEDDDEVVNKRAPTQHTYQSIASTMNYGGMYPVRNSRGYDKRHGEAYEWDADEEYLLPTGFNERLNRYGAFGGWDSRNPGMIDPGTGSRWQRTTGGPYGVERQNGKVRAMADGDDLDRWAQVPDYTRRGPSHTQWTRTHLPKNTSHIIPYADPYEEEAAAATSWVGRWKPPRPRFGIIDLNRSGTERGTGVRRPPSTRLGTGYYMDKDNNGYGHGDAFENPGRRSGRHSKGWDTSEDQRNMSMPRSSLDFYDPEF
ncbi:hypothetical protein LTR17_000844 [Elasticomyces elasticus]|nr:hypothetical protein LTR17_000844 [Elasticomyces elasticus]